MTRHDEQRLADDPSGAGYSLVRGSADDVDGLKSLWIHVHRHHAAVMPALGPYVSDEESWRERRSLYQDVLATDTGLLVLALQHDQVVGYGLTRVFPVEGSWLADTWATARDIAEIESLSVAPVHRGRGVGRQLLEFMCEHLRQSGIDNIIVGALAGNTGAIRLYESVGLRPTWLYLSNLGAADG